jgi:hypothetical protein
MIEYITVNILLMKFIWYIEVLVGSKDTMGATTLVITALSITLLNVKSFVTLSIMAELSVAFSL